MARLSSGSGFSFSNLRSIRRFCLLFENYISFAFLYHSVLFQSEIWKIAGLLTCASGLIFALTARIYLGENWSGTITIKKDHQLIQSGPYRITRNPIYTGFLIAFAGCAISLGQLRGWLGIIFIITAMLSQTALGFSTHVLLYSGRS